MEVIAKNFRRVRLLENIYSLDWNGKRELIFNKGDIVLGYLKKPLDGLVVRVGCKEYNLMLDEYELIKGKQHENEHSNQRGRRPDISN
jgi:hypothetical protein